MSGTWTRTRSAGMRKASASSSRTANGRCVPVQTVSLSPFHSATAARGSRGACAMYSTVYVCASLTSADAIPCSTEPLTCGESRSLFSSFFFRKSKSSLLEGCGGTLHSALISETARSAVQASAAATPTKSPSRTTVTPGFSAGRVSTETSLALNPAGRSTLPCSIPGRLRSEVY